MTIRMKSLRSFGVPGVNEGKVRCAREFVVANERRAKDLETEGLAYRIENKLINKSTELAQSPPENRAAESGPLDLVGGAIGADAPAPSSQAAPQRRRRRSRSSADESQS